MTTMRATKPRSIVLGIGNVLLSDEGIGVHTVEYLRKHHQPRSNTEYVDGGTLSFTLEELLDDLRDLIVVDAARHGGEPGAVQTFVGKDMDEFVGRAKSSAHEVGLADLMSIARLTDRLPPNRALIGIEPGQIDWGDAPSDCVSAAIPVAADIAAGLLDRWCQAAPRTGEPS